MQEIPPANPDFDSITLDKWNASIIREIEIKEVETGEKYDHLLVTTYRNDKTCDKDLDLNLWKLIAKQAASRPKSKPVKANNFNDAWSN